jgi:two-component system KDP operon response regulator KdpE
LEKPRFAAACFRFATAAHPVPATAWVPAGWVGEGYAIPYPHRIRIHCRPLERFPEGNPLSLMNPARVLLVDNEPHAQHVFRSALVMHGFDTSVAGSGEEALEQLGKVAADVILLHWNTPGHSSVATCRAVRKRCEIPMIVVSAPPAGRERTETLEAGADDFLIKPFAMKDLAARIRAVIQRGRLHRTRVLLDGVEIDMQSRAIMRFGVSLRLTSKEFKLLDHLLARAGEVVPYRRLMEVLWGPNAADEIEYLRVLINQLRKKIEPLPSQPKFIVTQPNAGYRFQLSRPNPQQESALSP